MNPIIQPKVSIILPVFNGDRYLAEAIESVLAQSFSSYELIAVNDGSTDKSAEILSRYASQDPERIFVLQHPKGINRGVAASRNLALRHARGEYIAFLDQDDMWDPRKLAVQAPFMDEEPIVGLSYTKSSIIREHGGENFMSGVQVLDDRPPANKQSTLYKIMLLELNYTFSSVMVRAEALRAIGGFMEDLGFQSDDRVMLSLVSASYFIDQVPEVLCSFRAGLHHYSGDLVKTRLAPVVVFELQLRVIRWLAYHGHFDWALYASHYVLPRTYTEAYLALSRLAQAKRSNTPDGPFSQLIVSRALGWWKTWNHANPLQLILDELAAYRAFAPEKVFTQSRDRLSISPESVLVTVIVPAYNAARTLADCLASILAQSYRFFELLIIDDGSTDETGQIAAQFAQRDPERVRLLTHPGGENRGVSASRNLGISRAKGKYCAFLDADDVWHPRKIEIQLAYMERFPRVALSYTKGRIIRTGEGHRFMADDHDILGHRSTRSRMFNAKMILMIEINYIFSSVMVRTDTIRDVGGFAENLPFQSEDRIMVACVSTRHLIGRIPRVLTDYHAHDQSYSVHAIRRNDASSIFIDMRIRVILWLLAQGAKPEALWLARHVIPTSILAYVRESKGRNFILFIKMITKLIVHLPGLPLEWVIIGLRSMMPGVRKP
jgi:glycosyltransferase involved in cell wall biosynthesis